MDKTASRRAAWDAYLAVTAGLVPALHAHRDGDGAAVNPRLGGVVIRIFRYAPMWGEDGQMLTAAAYSAVRLFHAGDRAALIALLHQIGRRLFALSAADTMRPRYGRGNQAVHRYPRPPHQRDRDRPRISRSEREQEGSSDD